MVDVFTLVLVSSLQHLPMPLSHTYSLLTHVTLSIAPCTKIGKVNKDIRNARKTWEYGQQSARKAARQFERSGKEFSLANIGGQAKKAVNNPQGKVLSLF